MKKMFCTLRIKRVLNTYIHKLMVTYIHTYIHTHTKNLNLPSPLQTTIPPWSLSVATQPASLLKIGQGSERCAWAGTRGWESRIRAIHPTTAVTSGGRRFPRVSPIIFVCICTYFKHFPLTYSAYIHTYIHT